MADQQARPNFDPRPVSASQFGLVMRQLTSVAEEEKQAALAS